jgi:hypothetical protein
VTQPFPLVVGAVGSTSSIGGVAQPELTEQSLSAYEAAYSVTLRRRTTIDVAAYLNDLDNTIKFGPVLPVRDAYTAANPPPGWPLAPSIVDLLAQNGVLLPQTGFTYRNVGPRRDKGVEIAVHHRVSLELSAFANYSWQARPRILASSDPFPLTELTLPPANRFNVGFNFDGARFLGSGSVNYSDKAFWSDVLTTPYRGFSDAYTMVNGTFGVKWSEGRLTTILKVTNLFDQTIQQHVFGDLLKRSAIVDVRIRL